MLSYIWYDFQPYYSSNHMKYTIEKRTGRSICETLIEMTRKLKERSEKRNKQAENKIQLTFAFTFQKN